MIIKLAWRNLWRNKLRTSIMLGAMVFGLTGVVTMVGFMNGLVDNMVHNAIAWQTSHLQIQNKQFKENADINAYVFDSQAIAEQLDNQPDVLKWSSRFLVDGMMASARSTRGVRIVGVDHEIEADFTPLSQHITDGSWFDGTGRHPILVSEKNAERLKLRVGSKVVLTLTDQGGEVTGAAFRVKGIFNTPSTSYDEGNVLVQKSDIQSIVHLPEVHEFAILAAAEIGAESRQSIMTLVSKINAYLPPENEARAWFDIQPLLASMMATMDVSNQVMLAVFVVAMGFGIINIMLMSVFERTQEFGVLMAVGMPKFKIFLLIMFETLFLGCVGAVLGVLSSVSVIGVLNFTGISLGSHSDGLGVYGVDTVLYPQVSVDQYIMVFIMVLFASSVSALYPARQILKQRPVEAMAERN
ncbi:ABC transporter permease [Vibrio methylphosphonaticus]|uniref:ABC transporter permease n=1 Tax=Vibrio methylphosphonaticus TaxID=2946866 RepID=UPI00202A9758|nr:FtsX-like permease family protein [Vibrio methylphosphonaticus]MCL9773604.1 FtsX-like permease family protein [Vibrio methylphosphonaticus]